MSVKTAVIAALNNKNTIGKNNTLPWHLPEDLKHFKKLTLNTPIIMGRKTFESVGTPLPKRTNIVVSSKMKPIHGIIVVPNIYKALDVAREIAQKNSFKRIFVVGGENIYREFLQKKLIDEAFLTRIDNNIIGDAFFPIELIENDPNWELAEERIFKKDEKNIYDMKFQYWVYNS